MDIEYPMTKAERTRQRILDTAGDMLYETGISGFKVDALVTQLGLTRQTFYRYFPSKQAVISAIVNEYGKVLSLNVFAELVRRELPFRPFLAEGVIVAVEMVKADKRLHKILGDNLQQAIAIMVKNFKAMEDELAPIVEPYVADAKQQGIVKPNVSTRDIMRWVFRTFLSEILLAELEDIEDRRQYLLKMLVPAICIDDASSQS